jgi:NADH dehydrogenase
MNPDGDADMSTQVVVLGSGYAGTGAVQRLENELGGDAQITWVSEHDYHLVLHEVHRCISNPSVESKVAIPIDEVKSPSTEFVEGRVTNIAVDERQVELENGDTVDYDYLLVALGSTTAFYGIEGLEEYSLELKGLDDAREIHQQVRDAAEDATPSDPARVVVGGAGLSGIQTAGEVAEYRDEHDVPIDIVLIEGLDQVLPNNDPELQGALRRRLENRGVEVKCGEFVSKVDEETIYVGGGEEDPEEVPYDVFVWTGGITGQHEVADCDIDKDERSNRIHTESDFTTSDDRVFALGDSALVEQGPDAIAPPTAQAAWQAAEVAGENVARAVRGQPLKTWTHHDKGTVVSIGEDAVAHGVEIFPINVFGGKPAQLLKKAIAVRWIADVASFSRAIRAWGDM